MTFRHHAPVRLAGRLAFSACPFLSRSDRAVDTTVFTGAAPEMPFGVEATTSLLVASINRAVGPENVGKAATRPIRGRSWADHFPRPPGKRCNSGAKIAHATAERAQCDPVVPEIVNPQTLSHLSSIPMQVPRQACGRRFELKTHSGGTPVWVPLPQPAIPSWRPTRHRMAPIEVRTGSSCCRHCHRTPIGGGWTDLNQRAILHDHAIRRPLSPSPFIVVVFASDDLSIP
jgi:hypothetical protein